LDLCSRVAMIFEPLELCIAHSSSWDSSISQSEEGLLELQHGQHLATPCLHHHKQGSLIVWWSPA
jgi:hypothetical protein